MASLGSLLDEEIRFFLAVNTAGVVETLLYGIHVVLFCLCMYVLVQNKRSTQWFIPVFAILMFALSTADISITIRVLTHDIVNALNPDKFAAIKRRVYAKSPIFASNNFIADLVLLYRCYMVWGRSKYILIGASFLVLADTVWGYIGLGESFASPSNTFIPLYIWSVFGINILLTLVTVGRIFWVSRIARPFIGHREIASFHTAIVVLVESSFIYSACMLVYLLFPLSSWYRVVVATINMRVVAIMPTLLIVQLGLGRVVRDTNNTETISEYEGRTTSVVLDTIFTTGSIIRPRIADEEAPAPEPPQNLMGIILSKASHQRQEATQ